MIVDTVEVGRDYILRSIIGAYEIKIDVTLPLVISIVSFDNRFTDDFHFIINDEAHVYGMNHDCCVIESFEVDINELEKL